MNGEKQLERLISCLSELVTILSNDPRCQWQKHFSSALSRAKKLKLFGYDQSDLNELSNSIRDVFCGSDSFNDYLPGTFDSTTNYFTMFSGMEQLVKVSGIVHDCALELMVIDKV
jgi:hypothetical protein